MKKDTPRETLVKVYREGKRHSQNSVATQCHGRIRQVQVFGQPTFSKTHSVWPFLTSLLNFWLMKLFRISPFKFVYQPAARICSTSQVVRLHAGTCVFTVRPQQEVIGSVWWKSSQKTQKNKDKEVKAAKSCHFWWKKSANAISIPSPVLSSFFARKKEMMPEN